MEVRFAKEEDLEFIKESYQALDHMMMELYCQLVEAGDDGDDEVHSDAYWRNLIDRKTGFIVIASCNKVSVGIEVVEKMDEKECHLEDLFICPEYRGKGYGSILVDEAKKQAKALGYKSMSLNVLPNNQNAKRLYQSKDFLEDKIHMSCKL